MATQCQMLQTEKPDLISSPPAHSRTQCGSRLWQLLSCRQGGALMCSCLYKWILVTALAGQCLPARLGRSIHQASAMTPVAENSLFWKMSALEWETDGAKIALLTVGGII